MKNVNHRLQELSRRSDTPTEFAFLKAVEEIGELAEGLLQPVFRDGKLLVETSLKEIRVLLVSQL